MPVSDAMHDICFCRGQLSQERTLPLQFIAAITSGRRALSFPNSPSTPNDIIGRQVVSRQPTRVEHNWMSGIALSTTMASGGPGL